MNNGGDGQELAATANISAFNVANAFGGFLGGMVLDGQLGAEMIPYVGVIVPIIGVLLILKANRNEKQAQPVESVIGLSPPCLTNLAVAC